MEPPKTVSTELHHKDVRPVPVTSAFHLEAAAPQAKRHLHVVRPCPPDESVQRVLHYMRHHPMFAGLSDDQLDRMLADGRIESIADGQQLYARGDASSRFYLVLDGQINLSLHSADGNEKIVDIFGPGQLFAEAVVFMENPTYQLSAFAASGASVASFRNATYLGILRESPDICMRVLRHLSNRLHVRIREIEGLTLETATHRVVRLLESRLPPGEDGPVTIVLGESRQELASYLSMKPETMSRVLRTLSASGALAVRGRLVDVASRAHLRENLHGQVV